MKFTWHYSNGYIQNFNLGKIHRYIMNYSGNNIVDHINNNSLDNRKQNLRIVTSQQNNMNVSSAKNSTSQYIGVSKNKWARTVSRITINRKCLHLGSFNTEEEAARARDEATKELFGEFGNLNFED